MRAFVGALLIGFILVFVASSAAVAQQRIEVAQKRTLFDILFGPKKTKPTPVTTKRTPTRRTPAPVRAPKFTVPQIINKNDNATRLAVFGDSLAIDLARALTRAYANNPDMAVLVLTAHDDDEYVFALLQAGANGYLLKTAEADELALLELCTEQPVQGEDDHAQQSEGGDVPEQPKAVPCHSDRSLANGRATATGVAARSCNQGHE